MNERRELFEKDDITLVAPCGIHSGACPMYRPS